MKQKSSSDSVSAYIKQFPPAVRRKLIKLRKTVLGAAPGATERLSYGMPTFDLHGPLVYFAAFKRHIGLYPTADGVQAFAAELQGYKLSKGTVQFPIDEEIPYPLVRRIVRYRVAQNRQRRKETRDRDATRS